MRKSCQKLNIYRLLSSACFKGGANLSAGPPYSCLQATWLHKMDTKPALLCSSQLNSQRAQLSQLHGPKWRPVIFYCIPSKKSSQKVLIQLLQIQIYYTLFKLFLNRSGIIQIFSIQVLLSNSISNISSNHRNLYGKNNYS